MIRSSSDWHSPPEALIPEAKKFIREAKKCKATIVGVGDLFDLLPLGRDKFKGCWAIDEMIDALGGYPFIYIGGNHDPSDWVKELFKRFPNVTVVKSILLEEGGRNYRFIHGHQRSDWWLWRHIAPGFVEFAVDHFPGAWYYLCVLLGWLPGVLKERVKLKPSYKETTKLNLLISAIQNAWIRHAASEGISQVIGHTHKAFSATWWSPQGIELELLDGGNLPDGSMVEIDEKGGLILWL